LGNFEDSREFRNRGKSGKDLGISKIMGNLEKIGVY
jgi:hypothetical protein